jgi:hypothetical protein
MSNFFPTSSIFIIPFFISFTSEVGSLKKLFFHLLRCRLLVSHRSTGVYYCLVPAILKIGLISTHSFVQTFLYNVRRGVLSTLTYLINKQPRLLIFELLPSLLVYFYVVKAVFSCSSKTNLPSILAYSILCVY